MCITEAKELDALRLAGLVVAQALQQMASAVAPGVTTMELDHIAARILDDYGAYSAPQKVYAFPGITCISLNDEAVHGVPGDRKLKEGDLCKLDVTVELGGVIADAAITVPVGKVSEQARRLSDCSRNALMQAMQVAKAGRRVYEIGRVIERYVHRQGFRVLRNLCGHGVGQAIHEEPVVPNFFDRSYDTVLKEGMVLTIEPIISVSSSEIVKGDDGWTLRTADGSLSAHFEYTLCITKSEPVILTPWTV